MARPKVYLTLKIPEEELNLLGSLCDFEINDKETSPSKQEIIKRIEDKDGLLCSLMEKVDKEIISHGSKLKVISSISVGFNHIDVPEATKKGIYVTNTPGILTNATADFAWALIMSSARRIVEADKYVRDKKWKIPWGLTMFLGSEIYGRTLGIIGLGRIGTGVAERAKGFKMKLIYYDVIRAPKEKEENLGIEYVPLEKLLKESDFISVHVPLTSETQNLISHNELKMMKPTAHLINTSRGPVVDEDALISALKNRTIAGSGLDVFEKEPIDLDNPLMELDNVTIAPHIASATRESRHGMAKMATENLLDVFKGLQPPQLVNPDVMKVRQLSETKMV
ncbi:2-hydroxyacid dehydrogenase [[Eubacterium] cellulosolvens]